MFGQPERRQPCGLTSAGFEETNKIRYMEQIDFGNNEGKGFGFAERLQQDWLNACIAADIPAVTRDTAARLMAVLYVHGGGHEEMVMNRKFTNEMRYIQRRYGIEGGEQPDAEVVGLIQQYVAELERYEGEHGKNSATDADGKKVLDSAPAWAVNLFRDRYGIKLRH